MASADTVEFNRDIRPLLSDKCFACHGPDKDHREADLRLDVEVLAKADAIKPGKPKESELIARIISDDSDERMPPPDSGKSLTKPEVDLLRRWIEQGAKYQPHWAYVAPRRRAIAAVKDESWPLGWVDRFVLSRLEQEALQPSPQADRVTLIRRLYFDLIGLPPSPQEVDQFVEVTDDHAYEVVVDRLLDSDRFGERMAMYWLDLVRYADTVGYHGDQDHSISPYRDWVIDAFNDNMPFDEFTKAQLAGDLLPDSDIDDKIATGYNRLLQTSHEGGVQPKEYLAIYAADRVRNLSAVWMGATMGCCQCHDHKFDPFTAKDFYAMVAFFADVDEAQHFTKGTNSLPAARPPEIAVHTKREREQIAAMENLIEDLSRQLEETDESDSKAIEKVKRQVEQATASHNALRNNARKTMVTVAIQPRPIRVLPRGNWLDDSGPIVEPAVPEFLGVVEANDRRASRLELAKWLTNVENGSGGLTARVFANRFWYLLFGIGLSRSLDDFGGQGEPPVHPELLDNLAVEFYESGWDIKHMMKLIVMSRAYQQSSVESNKLRERDPQNRFYARQSRFRLPAEMVRDNALAVSGLLVLDYFGPSAKPYQPTGYYRHLNFPTRKYSHDTDHRQWLRGVYVHWQRQFLHPMLKAMDAPSREECTAERPRSNTPLSALVLLNDPTFVEAARVLAEKILREGGDEYDTRLKFAFRQTVSREPDQFENELLKKLHSINFERFSADREAAKNLVSTGQAPSADDLDVSELAAWTSVTRTILNLSETVTRN